MPFAANLLHLASQESIGGRQTGSEDFQGPVYKQVGSLPRGLNRARTYKRNVSGRVTLLPGMNSGWSVSINVNKTRKYFPETFMARACFLNASQFPIREHCFQGSVSVSKMQIMRPLHSKEF